MGRAWGAPDGGAFLLAAHVCVLGEEDGVVGQRGLARGQDAPHQVAHHGQDPVVHKQVVHQELDRQRRRCTVWPGGGWGGGGDRDPSPHPPTPGLGQSRSLLRASPASPARVMVSDLCNPRPDGDGEASNTFSPRGRAGRQIWASGPRGPGSPGPRVASRREELPKPI